MKIAMIVARMLLGLAFVVFGLNAFLHFLNQSPPQGQAGAFIGVMFKSGYFYVVAVLQVLGGALLLAGRFVPFGLTLLGPVIVNILLFHIFLERTGLEIAIIVAVIAAFLVWGYRERFAPIFKA